LAERYVTDQGIIMPLKRKKKPGIGGQYVSPKQEDGEIEAAMRKKRNVFVIPEIVPAGKVLVHNQVRHDVFTRPGTSGFLAWLDVPSRSYVVCNCGWAKKAGKHYREKLRKF
jgi:hypothetical protein